MNGLRKYGIYTQLEFYSAMKKNEILSLTSKWTELENIILSKVNQAKKSYVLPHVWTLELKQMQ
jgi:hypothetical protein